MNSQSRRLLVVLAHPDDESFGMGGTLARYANEGSEVTLVCTTNGDLGTVEPQFLRGHDSIASLRRSEIQCAVEALNVEDLIMLGYRDSGMAGTPDNQHPNALTAAPSQGVVERITRIIREKRPQVVVTFDPYGGYGHPDHIRTYEATTEAFFAAGDEKMFGEQLADGLTPHSPQKLYYLTNDRQWLRRIIRVMPLFGIDPEHIGRNRDINLREMAAHQFPIHARVDVRSYAKIAQDASECHASQISGFGMPWWIMALRGVLETKKDTYMRAHPPGVQQLRETDLFQGAMVE